MSKIENQVRQHILTEFAHERPDLVLDDQFPLVDEEILDSVGIFVLIRSLEEMFAIKINPDDVLIENFRTISDIANLVRSRQSQSS